MWIEIHEYTPVWQGPFFDSNFDLAPERNPGHWVQTADIHPHCIYYHDILQHSVTITVPQGGCFTVPDPNMSVLLLCAHAFKDYAEWWFTDPTVRLSTLADIYDLSRHRQFDLQRFLTLVDTFTGHSAVAYAGCLMNTYFGFNPLPLHFSEHLSTPSHSGRRVFRFPRRVWHGFWVTIDWDADDLLIPSMDIASIVDKLGTNPVIVARDTPYFYSTCVERPGILFDRVIIQQTQGVQIPLQLLVTRTEAQLSFEVTVLAPNTLYTDRIRFDFGHALVEVVYNGSQESFEIEGIQCPTTLQRHENGYTVQLLIPWQACQRSPGTSIPLLIGMVRQKSVWEVVAGTLVPMKLTCA
jgi:hypothetical protein